MIDILVPPKKNLIKSKEIHGHVILDIHNTRSGFTERIEKHNTVTTNANEFLWWNYLAYFRSNGAYRPTTISNSLYGGVFLFEDAITGGTMLPLGANHWIGYAGSETAVAGNRGIYNAIESSSDIANGSVTSVWDWGTSQANGNIGSVARTYIDIGNGYFGSGGTSAMGYSIFWLSPQDTPHTHWTDHYVCVGIDKANDVMYVFSDYSLTYYSIPFTQSMSIKWGTLTTQYYPSCESMMTPICTSAVGDGSMKWLDVANHKIYAASIVTSGTSNDGVVKVGVVDLTAGTPEEVTTDVTMAGCYIYARGGLVISDGYIYMQGYASSETSRLGYYRLKISDNSTAFFDIYTVMENAGYDPTDYGPSELCRWGVSGIRCIMNGKKDNVAYTREVLFDQDGTAYVDEPNLQTGGSNRFRRGFGLGAGSDVYPFSIARELVNNSYGYETYAWFLLNTSVDYLGTYCNLDEAITKSSSETLKLTYTLSDS